MCRACSVCAAILFALCCSTRVLAADATASAGDHILHIGVVNVSRVYHSMSEAKKLSQDLRARGNELQQEQAKRQEEIRQLISQQQELKAGSAQWNELRNTIDDKKFALETWGKRAELELDRMKKNGLLAAYQHVGRAVQTIAQKQHLDLVISDTTPDVLGTDLDSISYAQLEQLLTLRSVLFTNNRADITDDVLTLVEADFAQSNPAGSTAAPAPGH